MEKYKYNSTNLIFGFIFSVLAVLILYVGISNVVKWNHFKDTAVPVNAEITDITKRTKRSGKHKNRTYDVDIRYEYEGNEYKSELNYYIEGMQVGGEVTIYIDPADPENNMSEPWNALVISIISTLVTGSVGAAFFIYELRRASYINRLIRENKFVLAKYTGEKPSGTKVRGVMYERSLFVFVDGSGNEITFMTHPHHPDKKQYHTGESVKVYVDMNAPKKHYVSREKK